MARKANSWEMVGWGLETGEKMLLSSEPGYGKTSVVAHFANRMQKPLFVVNMTLETAGAQLIGHFIPKGGEFVWNDGPIAAAMKAGGILLINEIDHAGPDASSTLHFACDDPEVARMTLPNQEKEVLKPSPGYQVVATMNGVHDDLTPALLDRFLIRIELKEINPEAVASLSADLRKFASPATLVGQGAARQSVGMRALAGFDRIRKNLGDEKASALVFGPRSDDFLTALKLASAK